MRRRRMTEKLVASTNEYSPSGRPRSQRHASFSMSPSIWTTSTSGNSSNRSRKPTAATCPDRRRRSVQVSPMTVVHGGIDVDDRAILQPSRHRRPRVLRRPFLLTQRGREQLESGPLWTVLGAQPQLRQATRQCGSGSSSCADHTYPPRGRCLGAAQTRRDLNQRDNLRRWAARGPLQRLTPVWRGQSRQLVSTPPRATPRLAPWPASAPQRATARSLRTFRR